ncbi:hypothetical protein TRFO_24587 [Tritrichomonas foetus]|uniref:Uncharacterized protein n=1 Tax=Tritrichomonas foetus TaxID=1144522 RepID=A0A1J4KD01_9EUKA|nr:hypothetical protein TRFO_24587 [Tritrichomonas foetus]|eukprot:OHT07317.1 hypothetical protein TRFO_24587 [Tritrichomonas foetus]
MHEFSLTQEMFEITQTLPIPHDFTFLVGKESYPFYKIYACILSPAVLHSLRGDATIEEYTILFEDEKHVFQKILDIFSGKNFNIINENAFDVYQIAVQLQNEQLMKECTSYIETTFHPSNILERTVSAIKFNVPLSPYISFIAENMEYLSMKEEILDIPIDILCEVLSSPKLSIPNQAWLVQWIESLIERYGKKYHQLLDSIKFNELEPNEICDILESVNNSNMTSEMCLKLKSLFIELLKSKNGNLALKFFTSDYEPNRIDSALKGIVYNLTQKFGGNVCDRGIMRVLVPTNLELARDLLNYDNRLNSHWKNDSFSDQNWIIFDFKSYLIQLKAYTIRGCYCKSYSCRPKSWEINGSNDMKDWKVIHKVTNFTHLNVPYGMHTFDVGELPEPYRYIRYKQLENNETVLNHIVHLSAMEFFGNLFKSI